MTTNHNSDTPSSPFTLPADEMKALGYRVVDMIVSHFESPGSKSPVYDATREEMDWLLQEPLPETGMSAMDVLDHVKENVLDKSAHLGHPRFYSFVSSPNNIVSVFADALATGFNVFSGAWVSSPGAAELEMLVNNWLLKLFGFPVVEGGGILLSGGSMANLTAIVMARKSVLGDDFQDGVIYWSDETHSSVERAANVVGLKPEQVRVIPSDEQFRIPLDRLRAAIEEDVASGKRPFMVVANAGSTNVGAIDPLYSLSTLCRHHGIWFHVDGAYGGAAILSDEGKQLLAGIELADSITIDPHKWFHQPFELGCLLVRDNRHLSNTFKNRPVYLRDLERAAGEINFSDQGIQLTRRFRALKLYMSLKTYGLAAFRESIDYSLELTRKLERVLQDRPDWEIITPATLSVINFRYHPANQALSEEQLEQLNQFISRQIISDGKAMLTTTVVKQKIVLRMCLINPLTQMGDLLSTLDSLEEYALQFLSESAL